MSNWDELQKYEEIKESKRKADKFFMTMVFAFFFTVIAIVVLFLMSAFSLGLGLITLFTVPDISDTMESCFNMFQIAFWIGVVVVPTFVVSIVMQIRANRAFKRMKKTMDEKRKPSHPVIIDGTYEEMSEEEADMYR
jgi:predicted membrane protein